MHKAIHEACHILNQGHNNKTLWAHRKCLSITRCKAQLVTLGTSQRTCLVNLIHKACKASHKSLIRFIQRVMGRSLGIHLIERNAKIRLRKNGDSKRKRLCSCGKLDRRNGMLARRKIKSLLPNKS